MDDETANRVYADPLARWFVTEAYRITDTGELIRAAGEQLVRAGLPLYRLAYFQLTLHPELAGKAYLWRRDRGVEVSEAAHGLLEGRAYLDNPLPPVFEERRTIRVRLAEVEPQAPLLKQLKAEGATDYVALPLLFTTGHVDALSVVSDKPGGFSSADLDRMFLLQFAFTRIVETHSLRDTATYLLDAYVGRAAGQRILSGEVKRGDGQTIEAILWYCDLRGFTRASDRLPRDAIIALLNDYFTIMGGAVTGAGGEVLKFMGDGMLAMLPIASQRAGGSGGARGRRCGGARHDAPHSVMRVAMESRRTSLAPHVGEMPATSVPARLDYGDRTGGQPRGAAGGKLCAELEPDHSPPRWPRCCRQRSRRSAATP
jgi:adenylate cyclase